MKKNSKKIHLNKPQLRVASINLFPSGMERGISFRSAEPESNVRSRKGKNEESDIPSFNQHKIKPRNFDPL